MLLLESTPDPSLGKITGDVCGVDGLCRSAFNGTLGDNVSVLADLGVPAIIRDSLRAAEIRSVSSVGEEEEGFVMTMRVCSNR